jgi:hypothetical protein
MESGTLEFVACRLLLVDKRCDDVVGLEGWPRQFENIAAEGCSNHLRYCILLTYCNSVGS